MAQTCADQAAEGELASESHNCDGGSCVVPRLCGGDARALEFRIDVGTRASIELSIVRAGTSTPLSVVGVYMSVFDLDGKAGDSQAGMAEAVAFRGPSVQPSSYYCTSCGPSSPGDAANAKSLWAVDRNDGFEFSARTYMTDDANGAGTGAVVGTVRHPKICEGCVNELSNIYGQGWTDRALAATITARLVGPFSSFFLDVSMRFQASVSSANSYIILNGPGPLVGECR